MLDKKIRVLFAGGGTVGSVSPLLAIKDQLAEHNFSSDFAWVGTKNGPEVGVIAKEKIPYFSIVTAKWRRYFSIKNFFDVFKFGWALFQSVNVIRKFKPDIILSAGSFVAVPVVLAGWAMKKKCFVHQQDIKPGLANRLVAGYATKVTVSFEKSLNDYRAIKPVYTGNPVRAQVLKGDKARALTKFELETDLPTVLIMGGSLGAGKVNETVFEAVPELIKFCQVLHITGVGNEIEWENKDEYGELAKRYHSHEYLHEELADVYAAADIVVSRAGLSALTELSILAKPTVLIPIPDNQQVDNAVFFAEQTAALVLSERSLNPSGFTSVLKELVQDSDRQTKLSEAISKMMPANGAAKYLDLIEKNL
jgi:UDP-N-acetylglucosamine--N-acetylmuramyl-(pentapeptide) pyrophosphoryl-undecaprenol N-acetylglucosamine transferase